MAELFWLVNYYIIYPDGYISMFDAEKFPTSFQVKPPVGFTRSLPADPAGQPAPTVSTGSTLTVSKNITQMVHVCAEHKKSRHSVRVFCSTGWMSTIELTLNCLGKSKKKLHSLVPGYPSLLVDILFLCGRLVDY